MEQSKWDDLRRHYVNGRFQKLSMTAIINVINYYECASTIPFITHNDYIKNQEGRGVASELPTKILKFNLDLENKCD